MARRVDAPDEHALLLRAHAVRAPQRLALHALPLNAERRKSGEGGAAHIVGQKVRHDGRRDDIADVLDVRAWRVCVVGGVCVFVFVLRVRVGVGVGKKWRARV